MDHLKLTMDKLSVDTVSDLVVDDSCGAVSIFVGTTRDNFEGKKVVRLEYEAYEPMAIKAMKAICESVRTQWPAVHGIAMYHRLGDVPCREASVIIAVSSPHRRDSLDAVSHCIDRLKASVPIWKKEVYDSGSAWKENVECPFQTDTSPPSSQTPIDNNLVQINVSNKELQQRINNFIERKRQQVNIANIHDFIPSKMKDGAEEEDTCARVRTQFVRRSGSTSHLKIHRVHNEWGPQTHARFDVPAQVEAIASSLPDSIAERVTSIEKYLNLTPISPDIFRRLKEMEDRIAHLQSVSPEYAQFWKTTPDKEELQQENLMDYTFSSDDISRKIEMFEKQGSL